MNFIAYRYIKCQEGGNVNIFASKSLDDLYSKMYKSFAYESMQESLGLEDSDCSDNSLMRDVVIKYGDFFSDEESISISEYNDDGDEVGLIYKN